MPGASSAGCRARSFAAVSRKIEALLSDRRARDRDGLFFVEGVRNFVQAVDNGFSVERILFSDRLLTSAIARKLVRQSRRSGVPTNKLTPEAFRKFSQAKRASGVAAVLRQRWARLEDVTPDHGLCWIAVGAVRSPGNLGTLIRSSQAVGGAGIFCAGDGVDPYAPAVVRSAMGSLFRQSFVRTTWPEIQRWAAAHGCPVIGASPDGATEMHRFAFPSAPLLLLGEERKGLDAQQRSLCGTLVRIPMQTGTDSLNLGVAGSLLMYEVLRCRNRTGRSGV